jgi:hypothetical protein
MMNVITIKVLIPPDPLTVRCKIGTASAVLNALLTQHGPGALYTKDGVLIPASDDLLLLEDDPFEYKPGVGEQDQNQA